MWIYTGEILIDDELEWFFSHCVNKDHNTLHVSLRGVGTYWKIMRKRYKGRKGIR